jgi:hypothetical protein
MLRGFALASILRQRFDQRIDPVARDQAGAVNVVSRGWRNRTLVAVQ